MLQSAPAPSSATPPLPPLLEGGGAGGGSSSLAAARNGGGGAARASLTASKPRRRGYDELTHPLLGDAPTLQLLAPRDEVGFGRRRAGEGENGGASGGGGWFGVSSLLDWWFSSRERTMAALRRERAAHPPQTMARTTPMRIEPKTFLANERTFLSWLHMAVTIGSIAAALLGFRKLPFEADPSLWVSFADGGAAELVKAMLSRAPDARPTAVQALRAATKLAASAARN